MPGKFHHETIYRGPETLDKLAGLRITLCGAGAVGSNLADNLVRQGVARLRVIDKDRVEEHNVSTQTYAQADVGVWKVEALRNRLFKVAGVEVEAMRKELTAQNARQALADCDLVIDAFDNAASRRLVQETVRAAGVACVHVGLYADYAEVIWDERYRVPNDVAGDVCDYPMARNLVLLATAVASETILRFAADGRREDWSVTLADFAIRPIDA
ncbi:MAG TPA: ThiF family adenylyltransferase [Tepidisphaeraceae bacterium]|jgi:molybdopterin/thiamine biosynthesis adenylyltransferase